MPMNGIEMFKGASRLLKELRNVSAVEDNLERIVSIVGLMLLKINYKNDYRQCSCTCKRNVQEKQWCCDTKLLEKIDGFQ